MQIRLAGIEPESIVDGPGYRLAVFTQGCPHNCPGCQNPQTHSFSVGTLRDTAEITALLGGDPLVRGVTLTGGEPMMQAAACCEIAQAAKAHGMNVWCYTGYTLEELQAQHDPDRMRLLGLIDVLVDGRYVAHERSLDLLYRGSRNQRLIDMPATLKSGEVCLFEPEAW